MVNCRVCSVQGDADDDAVDTDDGCGCGWIHEDCAAFCSGCDRWWCEDHFEEGGEIQGTCYCSDCYQGMKEALEDHFAAGREHGDW